MWTLEPNLYLNPALNGFLDTTPKEYNIFKKGGKLDFIKINNFYATNYTIKKVKSHSTKWGKIFVNHISAKEFVSRIYK